MSNVLKELWRDPEHHVYTIVALSYRGYWTSRGRPSQRGIEKDTVAALQWVNDEFKDPEVETVLVLWGQSIGAGIATWAAENYLRAHHEALSLSLPVKGVILETPFLSIRKMLVAIYPQKWLPYRYLWPFLRNWWDSEAALKGIQSLSAGGQFPLLIVKSAMDEVVPAGQTDYLYRHARSLGMKVTCIEVSGALHTEAVVRSQGREAVVKFIHQVARDTTQVKASEGWTRSN